MTLYKRKLKMNAIKFAKAQRKKGLDANIYKTKDGMYTISVKRR